MQGGGPARPADEAVCAPASDQPHLSASDGHANAEMGQGLPLPSAQRTVLVLRSRRALSSWHAALYRVRKAVVEGVRDREHSYRRCVAGRRVRREARDPRPRRRHPLAVVAEGGAEDTDAAVAAARARLRRRASGRVRPSPSGPRCCAASPICSSATVRRSGSLESRDAGKTAGGGPGRRRLRHRRLPLLRRPRRGRERRPGRRRRDPPTSTASSCMSPSASAR